MTSSPPSREGFADEYPFESRFAEIGGRRMHYVDEGPRDAPPLLMVHGNPTWSFAFRNVVKSFSPTHRCIAIDHIGCGFSEKPSDGYPYDLERRITDVVEFVEQLDLTGITLVAHDWGGCIGMGAAGRLPARFDRFVLSNTGAFRSRRIPFRIAVCRWPLVGPLGVRGLNLFAGMAVQMAVEKPLANAVRTGLLAPYDNWANRIAVQRFVEDIPMSPQHPSWNTLVGVEEGLSHLVQKPMLLVWGERDWCFTPAFREEFERRFPKAESVRIEDAGHYVFEDATERYLAAIRTFLDAGTPDAGQLEVDVEIESEIALSGFDTEGEPTIRVMSDGSLQLLFEFMPPSYAEDENESAKFEDFDVQLERSIGLPVLWEDREFFRIESPGADTVEKIREFVERYREQ